nr:hypothetical protein [uncultured Flavobacterium sp.]
MARNKLSDLNNHLFEQLERLNDESLSYEDLEKEMKRQKSMSEVASNIIEINRISMDAMKLIAKGNIQAKDLPNEIDTVKQKQIGN